MKFKNKSKGEKNMGIYDYEVEMPDGKMLKLQDYKGKVIILEKCVKTVL